MTIPTRSEKFRRSAAEQRAVSNEDRRRFRHHEVGQKTYLRVHWECLRVKHLAKLESYLHCLITGPQTVFYFRMTWVYHSFSTEIMVSDWHIIHKFCNCQLSCTEAQKTSQHPFKQFREWVVQFMEGHFSLSQHFVAGFCSSCGLVCCAYSFGCVLRWS